MKLLEFSRQFSTEKDCERYLKEQREKHGMVCPKCGCKKMYWDKCHKRWVCSKCRKEVTLTSGTVMHVERSFSWLENFRRLTIDYEYLADTAEAMVQLAFAQIMLTKFFQ